MEMKMVQHPNTCKIDNTELSIFFIKWILKRETKVSVQKGNLKRNQNLKLTKVGIKLPSHFKYKIKLNSGSLKS